ncbi:MAG: helix-turn-helix domain-containing protein [Bacteroidetes bacterium]|nr:helix-turn-helix domain-containing protein [Bacteroidota bacterium]
MEITFDQLPKAVSQLYDKLETIERLLLAKSDDPQPESDQLLTIQQAAEVLHLTVPTMYGLVQRASIPVCKRGKRLYFSKQELTSWIMAGRKKTISEIDAEAENYLSSRKRGRRS